MSCKGNVNINKVDSARYRAILRHCGDTRALSEGKLVHKQILECGHDRDRLVRNLLVEMYGKCGSLVDARAVFDGITCRNLFSWTIMIRAYAQNGLSLEAIHLFRNMQIQGMKPDMVTLSTVLSACCSSDEYLKQGKTIAEAVPSDWDTVLGNTLVNLYAKCNVLETAATAFEKLVEKDVGSWNAIISAYVQHGRVMEALSLYQKLQQEGMKADKVTLLSCIDLCSIIQSLSLGQVIHSHVNAAGLSGDIIVDSALINMYGKCGSLEYAVILFEGLQERDVVSWNTIISVFGQQGRNNEAFELFKRMEKEGVSPNKTTYGTVLDACGSLAAVTQGQMFHSRIMKDSSLLDSDAGIANSLISMYGRCGSLDDAASVFNNVDSKDVGSWNALISAYSNNGCIDQVDRMFHEMQQQGFKPDSGTFMIISSACSHVGLVEQAFNYFVSMVREHNIKPSSDHCRYMIDVLGRAGKLKEAEELMQKHGVNACSDALASKSMLSSCRIHGDMKRGASYASHVIQLEPNHSVGYVLLSNMYAAGERCDMVAI